MISMDHVLHITAFVAGLIIVLLTLSSTISTFVLPRSARSRLNLLFFGTLLQIFDLISHLAKTFREPRLLAKHPSSFF
jgi:hypothetical protein